MSENEENETETADGAEQGTVPEAVAADEASPDEASPRDVSPENVSADDVSPDHAGPDGVDATNAGDASPAVSEGTPVTFGDLPDGAAAAPGGGSTLELLYDVSLPITVELGRAALKVQDVLSLGEGSVVRLDRVAGDPVDVYVGSKKLAQAEVVVLDERFGVRITHIYADSGSLEAG